MTLKIDQTFGFGIQEITVFNSTIKSSPKKITILLVVVLVLVLVRPTMSNGHESLHYISFIQFKENISLNECDKTIIQKSITQLISVFSFD